VAPDPRATLSVPPSPQVMATVWLSDASASVKDTLNVLLPPSRTAVAWTVRSAGAWLLARTTRSTLELDFPRSWSATVALIVTGPAAL